MVNRTSRTRVGLLGGISLEWAGLDNWVRALTDGGCDVVLEISQFGSTRSMNAGAAAAIAMHAWVRRHTFGQGPTTP